jgi:hypothetical protein
MRHRPAVLARDRRLTNRDLNRALLARQLLLERSDISAADAIAQVGGLQAQASVPPFVGLWTRVANFDAADLQRGIDTRQIVRATMMRHTIHFVGADDYRWLRPTIQPALDANFAAQTRKRLADVDIEPFLEAARKQFRKAPLTFAEVKELIRSLAPDGDIDAIAYGVRTRLPLIGVPNESRWRFGGRAPFVPAEEWLGGKLAKPDPRAMARRYLAAFGPATPGDATAWSGVGGMRAVFESMRDELRSYRDEAGRELFDVPDGLLPGADVEAPVRFLPEFDNVVLAHADRSRLLDDAHRGLLTTKNLRVKATFLVDGRVAGGWSATRRRETATLTLTPWVKLTRRTVKELTAEGRKLLAFVEPDATEYQVVEEAG